MSDTPSLSAAMLAAKQMAALVADDQSARLDDDAAEVIAKMAVEFARVVAIDAAAFAAHRGRKVIGVEDVMLMARRDAALHGALAQFDADELQPKRDAKKAVVAMKAAAAAASAAGRG